jgi:predicted metal-dependent HD superfamily phosphohydrolase
MEDKPRILYSEDDIKEMKPRWMGLIPQKVDVAEKYWHMFEGLYREGQRHYHNFFHMKKLIKFFDDFAEPILK